MTIKIIPEPSLYLTREQNEQLRREYREFCKYHSAPPSFETFARRRVKQDKDDWMDTTLALRYAMSMR